MTDQPTSSWTLTEWAGGLAAAATAVGGLLFGWMRQRQSERGEGDNRADLARKEQVQLVLSRLEKTEAKLDDCEQKHGEANVRLAAVEERSKACEEDRVDLETRVASLEQRLL